MAKRASVGKPYRFYGLLGFFLSSAIPFFLITQKVGIVLVPPPYNAFTLHGTNHCTIGSSCYPEGQSPIANLKFALPLFLPKY